MVYNCVYYCMLYVYIHVTYDLPLLPHDALLHQSDSCICIEYIGVVCGIDVDVVSQYTCVYYRMCIYMLHIDL
jgi:hypothetical protein